MTDWPYIPARWQPSRQGNQIIWVVLHTMEAPIRSGTAASVGRYFQTVERYASAHVGTDPSGIVRYVPDAAGCYGAEGNSNRRGWHIEQAGYAANTNWSGPEGQAVLAQAATAAAYACGRFGIPARPLTDVELARFTPGFTTHAQITRVFRVPGGHTDPGGAYPVADLVGRVRALLGQSHLAPVADPARGNNRFRGFPTLRAGARDDPAAVAVARARGGAIVDARVPVLTLQSALNGAASAKLAGDGVFGDFVADAVRHFQRWWRDQGLDLDVDGIAGPATWSQLDTASDLQGR